jgi:anti-anti-sigma factor
VSSAAISLAPVLGVATERDGTTRRLRLSGELDLATVSALELELVRAQQPDGGLTVVDLAGLTFMDAAGMHMFKRAFLRARANGSRLRLIEGPPAVQRVFSVLGEDRHCPITTRRPGR